MSKTAGIVIIGNEVLSGKTQDINSHFFCTELRRLGVEVQKISTIQDEIELIGNEVAAFSKRFDYVFTSGGVGPTFKGSFGNRRQWADGTSGVMDENYIRESLLNPRAKVVAGFDPVMPTFQGRLKENEISALIAYLRGLK